MHVIRPHFPPLEEEFIINSKYFSIRPEIICAITA